MPYRTRIYIGRVPAGSNTVQTDFFIYRKVNGNKKEIGIARVFGPNSKEDYLTLGQFFAGDNTRLSSIQKNLLAIIEKHLPWPP